LLDNFFGKFQTKMLSGVLSEIQIKQSFFAILWMIPKTFPSKYYEASSMDII